LNFLGETSRTNLPVSALGAKHKGSPVRSQVAERNRRDMILPDGVRSRKKAGKEAETPVDDDDDDIDLDDWNDELEDEVDSGKKYSLIVYSRDWTVETIAVQIKRGNIDLNPRFQRRNAWRDDKRSKLIESLLIGVPIPEIVMAESKEEKNSFIIIDGKQRLSAIAGFLEPEFGSWENPVLSGLKSLDTLNGKSFADLARRGSESSFQRNLRNSAIRCTVVSNYDDTDVLYDIFYRLNSGSVPLSSQELRQALNRGPFSDFIMTSTNDRMPLHQVLNLSSPDRRLRDAEILLRFIALTLFGKDYAGALSPFLDSTMRKINKNWKSDSYKSKVTSILDSFNQATDNLLKTFPKNRVGRRYSDDKWEGRFNRALFEVQAYYFSKIPETKLTKSASEKFLKAFQRLCSEDEDFRESIGATTEVVPLPGTAG
jgi:hypothetical protein